MNLCRILLLCGFSVAACHAQRRASVLILEHANVFTGPHSTPQLDVTITVADGRIERIQPSLQAPQDSSITDRIINLHGGWVLPGLIDAHVHVYDIQSAHRMLTAGVTTGRSMLTTGYEDVGLKALYAHGDHDLPDILSCGFPVVAHPNRFQPDISSLFLDNLDLDNLRFLDRIGPEGARQVVQDNAKRHVDWIKVFANGRAGVPSADPKSRDLDNDELRAAVKEANDLGIPAAVHAYSDDGATQAVMAGVKTVEHGALITEATLRLMKERQVCFTPTLSAFYAFADANSHGSPEEKLLAARAQMMIEGSHEAITTARRMGVAIIAGSDTEYGADDQPTVIDEILRLADAGLQPGEALDAATGASATCLNLAKTKGYVKVGLDADLVVYGTDPLKDLHVLRNPLMVITRGTIFMDKLTK